MYTPDLRLNLISVSRLLEKGADAIFSVTDNSVSIKMPSGPIIFSTTKKGNLFYVDVEQDECTAYLSQSMQKPVDFATWHRCLAHAGTDTLQNMIRNKLVDRMNTYGEMALGGMCKNCIFGKHTSHPYNGTTVKERDVLEHIHIDLWGPAQVQSAGGAHYFMAITDDFSSYRTVAFLASKSAEATSKVFKAYHKEAEHQTRRKLKRIRLDMGREWFNNTWEQYRNDEGLIFEFTTPYAHQQNGVAEKGMQTILEAARSILAESGLPTKYWADAIQTVVYVKNFLPSPRQPNKIPAELWHGQRQDVSHLHPFGCMAYAHIPLDLNISKLQPRSVWVTLLGYNGRNGYKLLDRSTGAMFLSRDVIFEEGTTHLAQPSIPTVIAGDVQPSVPTVIVEDENPCTTDLSWSNNDVANQFAIAPRPLPSQDLHDHELTEDEVISPEVVVEPSLAMRRTRRAPMPSTRLCESLEYLNRATISSIEVDTWVPRTYIEAMK